MNMGSRYQLLPPLPFVEYAASMDMDGGLGRDDAEQQALALLVHR